MPSTPDPQTAKGAGTGRNSFWMAVVFVLGVGMSLAAFFISRHWDEERAHLHLSLQAHAAAAAVGAAADRCDEALHGLSELLGRRDDLSRADFAEIAGPLLRRQPGLLALQWVPVVPHAERPEVEGRAQRELGRPFEFSQLDAAGGRQRAAVREAYWPILFAEPVAGNESALGFDLSMETTRPALLQARDTADLVLSIPIRLGQAPGSQLGYVAIMPVYRGGRIPAVEAERPARLTGFVQGILRTGDFLTVAMREAPTGLIELMGMDLMPGSPFRVVHPAAPQRGERPAPTEAQMRAGWHLELKIKHGERQFALLFRPAPGAMAALRSWNP